MTYKQRIADLLQRSDIAKDDDQHLFTLVLSGLDFDVIKRPAIDLISLTRDNRLPSLDTVSRLRRRVQEENPSLRGKLWDERHGVKIEKALSDICA